MAKSTATQSGKPPQKQRLGRGLATLIGEMDKPVVPLADEPEAKASTVGADRLVEIGQIVANPHNPRRQFDRDELEDLANSIREHGIVQPILVRPMGGEFELIAGERRWRAAQKAGLHQVPVVIREVDDRQALELAIIENVQRADLNPVEEALGYQQLMDDHSYKQAELGKVIGKSRSHVANTLRLLNLPDAVRAMLAEGMISPGHARALVPMTDSTGLAKRIVAEGLSVREVEVIAANDGRSGLSTGGGGKKGKTGKDADTLAVEKRIADAVGLKVDIRHKPNGRGKVVIDYKNMEQLDSLLAKLVRPLKDGKS